MADVTTNTQVGSEETVVTNVETVETVEPQVAEKQKEKEPSVQDLMVEIAKLKREKDKASSEAADFKKKWKDSMTEAEKASMEKAEAQAQRDAEFESMKRQLSINDLTENFMDLGYPKDLAKKAATAQTDGDATTLLEAQKQFNAFQKKQWEEDFLASRPDVNIGGTSGKSYTKEQFDKMNPIELTKLKRENPAEYDRLMAM